MDTQSAGFYEAGDLLDFDSLTHEPGWLERELARLAVERGLTIPPRGWLRLRATFVRSSQSLSGKTRRAEADVR